MVERQVEICNQRGLHARAAAKFVHLASGFDCRVTVCNGKDEADGKSILSLMVLGASQGTELTLRCEGEDEQAAADALTALVGGGFDEES
jgi:phosphocarrier protein